MFRGVQRQVFNFLKAGGAIREHFKPHCLHRLSLCNCSTQAPFRGGGKKHFNHVLRE